MPQRSLEWTQKLSLCTLVHLHGPSAAWRQKPPWERRLKIPALCEAGCGPWELSGNSLTFAIGDQDT